MKGIVPCNDDEDDKEREHEDATEKRKENGPEYKINKDVTKFLDNSVETGNEGGV